MNFNYDELCGHGVPFDQCNECKNPEDGNGFLSDEPDGIDAIIQGEMLDEKIRKNSARRV